LTGCLAVVVRYFGGTKLGVGGLIEAYREATLAALEVEVVERFVERTFRISFPYARMGDVMSHLKKWDVSPNATDFDISCSLEASIRLRDADSFANGLESFDVRVQALRTK
jgi:putative IMPACT (imprinted ancient) family translation regulator